MPTTAPMTAPRWKIAVALGIVYIVWGSTFLAIRIAVDTMPPFWLAGMRFLLAGLMLYIPARWLHGKSVPWIHWKIAAIVGFLLLVSGNGIVVWSEQTMDSGLAALIIGSVPLWMVGLQAAYKKRRPAPRVQVGLVMGLVGVSILVPHGSASGSSTWVALALVAASFSWSYGTLYSKRNPLPGSPSLGAGMEMIAGGVILMAISTIRGDWIILRAQPVSPSAWISLAYLIVFGSVIAFSAYRWLIPRISTAQLSTYAYVNPVVAVFLGWSCLNEALSLRLLMGAVIILSSVILISIPARQTNTPAATVRHNC